MELTLTTPALLFSSISLIMLAYTNRFLAYANTIRNLHTAYKHDPSKIIKAQIVNLRKRLYLTRSMQIFGITSLLLCVLYLYPARIYCCLDFWSGPYFIDYFSSLIDLGNSNFS